MRCQGRWQEIDTAGLGKVSGRAVRLAVQGTATEHRLWRILGDGGQGHRQNPLVLINDFAFKWVCYLLALN